MFINETQSQTETFAEIIENMEDRLKESFQIDELISHLALFTQESSQSVSKLYRDAEFLQRSTYEIDQLISILKVTLKNVP